MRKTSKQLVRAVAYIRISEMGDRTAKDLISDKAQLHEIQQHARRYGYEIVEVMSDLDETGRDFSRRKVAKIIEMVRGGEIEVVLLWKWSRWGRNTNQSLMYIAQLEQAGGRVEAATEHFDTETSYGKFGRGLFLLLAELQSDQIGDGWKDTQEFRRRLGLPHTAAPRFGYRYNRDADPAPRYEVHEEEAKLLRSAYERFVADVMSIRGLAMEWNRLGVKTTQGGAWGATSMRTMLDTGFGAGWIRERSKQPKQGQPNSRRPEAFDVWREGSHDAVISTELWEAYQRKRKAASRIPPAARVPKHGLSGMLFCPRCGQTMKAHLSGPECRYVQWVCRAGVDRLHPPVTISNIRAEKVIMSWLADQAQGGESVTEDAQRLVDQQHAAEREVGALRSDLAAAERKFQRLQKLWLDGDFTKEFYEAQKASLGGEVTDLRERLDVAEARDSRSAQRPEVAAFVGLQRRWRDYPAAHRRAALLTLLAGAVVVSKRDLLLVPAWA